MLLPYIQQSECVPRLVGTTFLTSAVDSLQLIDQALSCDADPGSSAYRLRQLAHLPLPDWLIDWDNWHEAQLSHVNPFRQGSLGKNRGKPQTTRPYSLRATRDLCANLVNTTCKALALK
ncbi:unnamed protein product [Protopolystoma xenopodis]|uniref:Uncharacterized protein n=1 Tax=Protopolystoma xenopodis TaxID=117903 RepID=A0A3S5AEX7_9PLAT|nr:unnamed protein product [Protopolystoma xenopodis]